MKITSKLLDSTIENTVFIYLDEHFGMINDDFIPSITKKLMPEIMKFPEVQQEVLENVLECVINDDPYDTGLLRFEIERFIQFQCSLSINRGIRKYFKALKEQQAEEYFESTKGMSL